MLYRSLLTLLGVFFSLSAGEGDAEVPPWHPPTPDSFRGPCPMMNTLANHGFLPRDGRGITKKTVIDAMGNALNFDAGLASIMFDQAVIANPEPNATFFTLRTDAYFGSNHVFNQTIFDETKFYWTASVLDANMLASSKLARQVSSKAFNPTYKFTANTESFSLGEIAAPVIAFGDLKAVTVPRNLVEYFFVNERLPVELGWTKKTHKIKLEDIMAVTSRIQSATTLFTDSNPNVAAEHSTRRLFDIHNPLRLQRSPQ